VSEAHQLCVQEDLVTAAAQGMSRSSKRRGRRMRDSRQPLASAASVAVLRGVVERLRSDGATGSPDWRDAYTQAANDFEMLADEIEGDSRG
jgi:hypothetical protein